MYTLKPTTKRNIEDCISLSFSELLSMDDDELRLLKSIDGEEVVFSSEIDPRKIVRGNPFLALGRFKTIEEVEKRLAEMVNEDI